MRGPTSTLSLAPYLPLVLSLALYLPLPLLLLLTLPLIRVSRERSKFLATHTERRGFKEWPVVVLTLFVRDQERVWGAQRLRTHRHLRRKERRDMKKGFSKRWVVSFVAVFTLLGVLAEIQEAFGHDRERRHRHRLHSCLVMEFDANGDGVLSEEEKAAAIAAREQELIETYDTDGDGALSDEEKAAAREDLAAQRAARRAARLAEIDTDGDGTVSEEELAAARAARLAEIDTDGDGEISDEERAAALAARCEARRMSEDDEQEMVVIEALTLSRDFVRGDANSDGETDLSDSVFVLNFLFVSGESPVCLDAADANDDGTIDVADPIRTLNALFISGAEPLPPPTVAAGADPTLDEIDCDGGLNS